MLNRHVMSGAGAAERLCAEWDLAQLAICPDARGMHRIHKLLPSDEQSSAYDLHGEEAVSPKHYHPKMTLRGFTRK